VKLAITLPIQLKEQLDRYAAVHSQTWGEPVDAATLIPHMLAQFVARDHAFRVANAKSRSYTTTTDSRAAATKRDP
jgi:hypothetical protein